MATAKIVETQKKKKHDRKVKDHTDAIYHLVYVLGVLLFCIPTVIELAGTVPDARLGIAFLKFTSLFAILAKPFTMMVNLSAAPENLLFEAFPGIDSVVTGRFAEVTDFNALFQGYINVPDLLFILPFVFLCIALVYLGYKSSKDKNAAWLGIRYALGHYLGSLAGFVIFWGIIGMLYGFWGLGYIITQLFSIWISGWADFLWWILLSIILVSVGKFAADKHPPEDHEAAQYLVSSLQQPVPRAYKAQELPLQASPPKMQVEVEVPQKITEKVQPPIQKAVKQYCEFCGARVVVGSLFCAGCGVSLEEPTPGGPAHEELPSVSKPAVYINIPQGALMSEPEKGRKQLERRTGKPEITEKELEEMEGAIHKIDEISPKWALFMMGVSIIAGLIGLAYANYAFFAYCLLALPFGFMTWVKDKTIFTKWVFERNYQSRGIDLIIYGLMGMACAGAGLLVFAKGVLMLLITQNTPEKFPKLDGQQWRARVFQASTASAETWLLLSTVAGASRFAEFTPFGMTWALVSTVLGFMVYYLYTKVLKPEILRGNLGDIDAPLIIAGIAAIILNGGGILILVQGILIAVQKDERKKPDTLLDEQDRKSVELEIPIENFTEDNQDSDENLKELQDTNDEMNQA